jgi:phosphoglycerate-specific signal transduction histidine kinase
VAQQDSGAELGSLLAVIQAGDELRQSLAAASNYLGVARLLLRSDNSPPASKAIDNLDKAEAQILRAGEIVRRLGRAAQQAKASSESVIQ